MPYNGYNELDNTLFYAYVPALATMSEWELENIGMPNVIRDGEEERPAMLADTLVKISVNRMIDIYSNGFNIRILHKEDIPIIYSILVDYLEGAPNGYAVSMNMTRGVDNRAGMIKSFMSGVLKYNKQPIMRSSINLSKATNGFDIGIGFSTIGGVGKTGFSIPKNDTEVVAESRTHSYGGLRYTEDNTEDDSYDSYYGGVPHIERR